MINPRITEDDRALIHAVQIVPRISWTDAGEILDVHPTTLANRWDRLHNAGLAWATSRLKARTLDLLFSFHDIDCKLSKRSSLIEAVSQIPEVNTVDVSARNKVLELTIVTPTLSDLGDRVLPQIAGLPGVRRIDTSLATKIYSAADAWRLDSLSRTQIAALNALPKPEPEPSVPIPENYRPILHALAHNGRASAAEISRETGIHKATVRRQLNRLIQTDSLVFRCEVAQPMLGYPFNCIWYAKLPAERHQRAAKVLAKFQNLRLCISTTGPTNFLFSFWLRSMADVLTTETTVNSLIEGIQLMESSVVMTTAKRTGWLLRPDGTSTGTIIQPPTADPRLH